MCQPKLCYIIEPTFSNVEVEKVTIEGCLHAASHDGYQVVKPFSVVAIDPINNVECSVAAEGKEIVRGDGFRLPCLGNHVELRHDGHRFQIYGERPQNL